MSKPEQVHRSIPRLKRSDLIVEEMKGWIVTRRMKAGDRLPQERELIEIFESGRGTVREALKVLESQGMVERVPGANGGARVATVSYEQTSQFLRNYLYFQPLSWAQIYRTRELLEPVLAGEVTGRLSEADFASLEATIDLCRHGVTGKIPPWKHRDAELEFHAILARACPDPMLRLIANFITDLLRDFSEHRNVIEPRDSAFAQSTLRHHTELLDAFRANDRARVESAMAEHIHDAGCLVSERESDFDGYFMLGRFGQR